MLDVGVLRFPLLHLVDELAKVATDHPFNVPPVEHLDNFIELHLVALLIIGKIDSRDAKLVEDRAFDLLTVAQEYAYAAHVAARHFNVGTELLSLAFPNGQQLLGRKAVGTKQYGQEEQDSFSE